MNNIIDTYNSMEASGNAINDIITSMKVTMKISYKNSRDIRFHAQKIKKIAQDLRTVAMAEFKKTKGVVETPAA